MDRGQQIQDDEVLALLKRNRKEIRAGRELAVQQFRVCRARFDRIQGIWHDFRRLLHNRIFRPLQMNYTVVFRNGKK